MYKLTKHIGTLTKQEKQAKVSAIKRVIEYLKVS